MPGSERDEPNVSYPELTAALGVLRDAYQQVEAPFVFQPAADALGMQPGWMLRRRIFTLATGALATAAGIVMAFTVVVEVPRGQVQPAGVVTRLTPPSQEQPRVAVAEAVKSTRASVEVSLAGAALERTLVGARYDSRDHEQRRVVGGADAWSNEPAFLDGLYLQTFDQNPESNPHSQEKEQCTRRDE